MFKVSNQLISKYRTPLLGIASLLILVSHFNPFPDIKVVSFIQSRCIVGVDIFLFLSGFGLVYSINKNHSISYFYNQRLKRILPIYLPVSLVFCAILVFEDKNLVGGKEIFLILSTLGYWLKTDWFLEWYTPSIVLLYLFFPMIYMGIKYVKKENCFYVITLLYYLLMLCIASGYQPWTFLIFRIPIFLIGVLVAEKHSSIHVSWAFGLFLISILVYTFKLIDVESNNRVWLFSVANSSLFVLIIGVVFVRLVDIKLGLFVKSLSF